MKLYITYARTQTATRVLDVPYMATEAEINDLLRNLPLQWEGEPYIAKQIMYDDDGEIVSAKMEIR